MWRTALTLRTDDPALTLTDLGMSKSGRFSINVLLRCNGSKTSQQPCLQLSGLASHQLFISCLKTVTSIFISNPYVFRGSTFKCTLEGHQHDAVMASSFSLS